MWTGREGRVGGASGVRPRPAPGTGAVTGAATGAVAGAVRVAGVKPGMPVETGDTGDAGDAGDAGGTFAVTGTRSDRARTWSEVTLTRPGLASGTRTGMGASLTTMPLPAVNGVGVSTWSGPRYQSGFGPRGGTGRARLLSGLVLGAGRVRQGVR